MTTTTRALHQTTLICVTALFAAACDSSPSAPDSPSDGAPTELAAAKPTDKGKKPRKNEPAGEPDPAPEYVWYRLAVADDSDPLWRFGIDGDSALLESDPDAAGWGTDYWGYWSEPFSFVDGQVHYVVGLTETTYTFTPHPEGLDVSKRVVVHPYLGGEPTTTETHVGVFRLEG